MRYTGFSIHAAGLDIRRPGKAFKAADLFTQHRVLGTQSRLIFKKFQNQRLQGGDIKLVDIRRRFGHNRIESQQ